MPREAKPIHAPKDSGAHIKLLAAAARARQNTDLLRDILWLINAHYDLIALPKIAMNLRLTLQLIRPLWGSQLEELRVDVPKWIHVLSWIEKFRSQLRDEIGPAFDPDAKFKAHSTKPENPILGEHAKRHPLYAGLWENHEDPDWDPRYRMLMAHMLLGHIQLARRDSTREVYEAYSGKKEWSPNGNSLYEPFLALRHFASDDWLVVRHLQRLPVEQTPTRFVAEMQKAKPENVLFVHWHEELQWFLEKMFGPRSWIKRTYPGRQSRSDERSWWGREEIAPGLYSETFTHGDPQDRDFGWGWNERITLDKSSEQLREGALEEDDDTLILSLPDQEDDAPPCDPAEVAAATAWAQVCHIEMSNQLLPWTYNALSADEVGGLLHNLATRYGHLLDPENRQRKYDDLKQEEKFRSKERELSAIIALIVTMLVTGSSLERALSLSWINAPENNSSTSGLRAKSKKKQPESPSLVLCMFHLEGHYWGLPALVPNYRKPAISSPEKARQRISDIFLPDILGASAWPAHVESGILPGPVFRGKDLGTFYLPRIKRLLEEMDPTGRFTLTRLSQFLFRRVVDITGGDIAAASLITGNVHPLMKTKLSYATPSVQSLQQIYIDAVKALPVIPHSKPTVWQPKNNRLYVGSRDCPTRESVREAVGKLRFDMQRAELAQEKDLIDYHNRYTLYSIWTLHYATGIRPIRTPYLASEQVDLTTGLAHIADKGFGYRSRLLWIPPATRHQMEHYWHHLRALRDRMPYFFTTATRDMPCFFLLHGTVQEVREKLLAEQMEPYLRFTVNVHRRFMRYELLDAKCPPEVVDAWMGHWWQGEEPWGCYSSFPFAEHRRQLNTYLVPVLSRLGFLPLKSRLLWFQ